VSLGKPRLIVPGFNPFGDTPREAPAVAVAMEPGALPPPHGLLACTACTCRTEAMRVVPGHGPADATVLFLGQNPGDEEDLQGKPFVGMSGAEFDRWLGILGMHRPRVFVTNVVKCHTTNNRPPKPAEIQTCSYQWLPQELQALTALQVILPLGKPAAQRLLGKAAPPTTPLMVHHFRVRVSLLDRDISIFPLPHPAYFLRAQHFGPTFRDVLLPQIRETLQREYPMVYDACRRH
jgi:DNA polymerase